MRPRVGNKSGRLAGDRAIRVPTKHAEIVNPVYKGVVVARFVHERKCPVSGLHISRCRVEAVGRKRSDGHVTVVDSVRWLWEVLRSIFLLQETNRGLSV